LFETSVTPAIEKSSKEELKEISAVAGVASYTKLLRWNNENCTAFEVIRVT
jgi:hypothetical protein